MIICYSSKGSNFKLRITVKHEFVSVSIETFERSVAALILVVLYRLIDNSY